MSPTHHGKGQKVDLGQDAPIKEEGAGKVASESLAAESVEEGGEFASNKGIRSENNSNRDTRSENQSSSGSENTSSGRTTNTSSAPSSGSGSGASVAPESADTAPSYANNQYVKASGPHGKNLKEGIDYSNTEDGLKKALASEPGSEDDPSRLAELQFQQNQSAVGRDAGPKQSELSGKTAFDGLNSETSS
ncbi:Ff.00g109850.m01.CDS01 [Fusarium sp. VM40]|nr:Ff.00g109850.m01.CDS01 [Fusarium sp. VM40]